MAANNVPVLPENNLGVKVPLGTVVKDKKNGKEWILGPPLGTGGFGTVYRAKQVKMPSPPYLFAVKIEPSQQSTIRKERVFFTDVCLFEKMNDWKRKRGIAFLGLPILRGQGTFVTNQNDRFDFIAMDKLGDNLHEFFVQNKRVLAPALISRVSVQMIDILEYIHQCGFIHNDIKAKNILFSKDNKKEFYLVDFGLATRYHKGEAKVSANVTHMGTLPYISSDIHNGLATRRGDLQSLGFSIVQWIRSKLPWEHLEDLILVVQHKRRFFLNLNSNKEELPKPILDYFKLVLALGVKDDPDYNKLKQAMASYSTYKEK